MTVGRRNKEYSKCNQYLVITDYEVVSLSDKMGEVVKIALFEREVDLFLTNPPLVLICSISASHLELASGAGSSHRKNYLKYSISSINPK